MLLSIFITVMQKSHCQYYNARRKYIVFVYHVAFYCIAFNLSLFKTNCTVFFICLIVIKNKVTIWTILDFIS